MSAIPTAGDDAESRARILRREQACDRFEDAWKAGHRPRIEDYLAEVPEPEQPELSKHLLDLELVYRLRGGEKYVLGDELGRGGMGVVYKALQLSLNRWVALKMIKSDQATANQLARFESEAEAISRLSHTNIVQIYDVTKVGKHPCIVMELLEGGSLADRLRGTTLKASNAAKLIVPLALAMEVAHSVGIVHRDLKPQNVLFDVQDVSRITDFGLAKRMEVENGQTHTGEPIGTPSYMAPEQALGSREIGPFTDVYALGAILYEMLTGRPPFKGSSPIETIEQVIHDDPVPPSRLSRIPRDLETICLKCLEKQPHKRYASTKELADELNRYLAGQPIKTRRTPTLERAGKWAWRNPRKSATIVASLAILPTLGLWQRTEQRRERAEERRKDQLVQQVYQANGIAQVYLNADRFAEARIRSIPPWKRPLENHH